MEAQDLFWAYRNKFQKNIIYYTGNSINKLRLPAFSASTQLRFLFIFQLFVELQFQQIIPDKMRKTFSKILQCRQTSWVNLWNINSFGTVSNLVTKAHKD